MQAGRTQSVNRKPGKMELIRSLGPCVVAMHFIRCNPEDKLTILGSADHANAASNITCSFRDRVRKRRTPSVMNALLMLIRARSTMLGVSLTATEEVIRNTPPSGLALKVGIASRRRWRFPFALTAQHCFDQT